MALKLSELRKLPKRELWTLYDKQSETLSPSLNHYRDEIIRREQCTQTKWIKWLTISVLVVTVVSAIGVFAR